MFILYLDGLTVWSNVRRSPVRDALHVHRKSLLYDAVVLQLNGLVRLVGDLATKETMLDLNLSNASIGLAEILCQFIKATLAR